MLKVNFLKKKTNKLVPTRDKNVNFIHVISIGLDYN